MSFVRRYALPALAALALSPLAVSHYDDKEVHQSYRQSYFAIMAMNYGPMVAMVKGELPWDDERMASHADQLASLVELDVMRGFAEGSDKGTTRAKPGIWENMEDFEAKFEDTATAIIALNQATGEGADREAISGEVAAVGKACKACHDEYKSEDYLY
jgi:cytochrome c556